MEVLREIADLGEAVVDVDLRPPQLDEVYAYFMVPNRPS